MESTAVWSLKPEQWGSLLVQEKYQEEKPVTRDINNNNNNNNNDDDNNNNNNNNNNTADYLQRSEILC